MFSLILDTSSEYTLLGLVQENQLIDQITLLHTNQLSENLIPSIQYLLKKINSPLIN